MDACQREDATGVRDAWLGLRTLTNHYTPKYYEKEDGQGKRLKPDGHAEAAAEHLASFKLRDWPTQQQDIE
jgi:hypothetical protein